MARIKIKNDKLIIRMQGARKLWSLRSELAIPLDNVMGITFDTDIWKDTPKPGEKCIGTDMYGFYFAGSFVQDDNRMFYDLKGKEDAIVISLKDEQFDFVIIGVENPHEVVETIEKELLKKH